VGYRHWKSRGKRQNTANLPLEAWHNVAATVSDKTDAATAADAVHALLAHMGPRDRLVLTLLYLEQCTVAEAAELCGWTQTMVKVQAYRARNRLRKLLGDDR
jgi:RNA polymerase sigma-70 factor (ECF subfamily)